eukprot:1037375-Prymnesium_polylepis.1
MVRVDEWSWSNHGPKYGPDHHSNVACCGATVCMSSQRAAAVCRQLQQQWRWARAGVPPAALGAAACRARRGSASGDG